MYAAQPAIESAAYSALSEAQANTIPLYTPRLVNLPFIQYALCKLQSLEKDVSML